MKSSATVHNRLTKDSPLSKDWEVMFTIFKEGATLSGPVDIINKKGQPYEIDRKMAFYKSLGYTVSK